MFAFKDKVRISGLLMTSSKNILQCRRCPLCAIFGYKVDVITMSRTSLDHKPDEPETGKISEIVIYGDQTYPGLSVNLVGVVIRSISC